MIFRTNKNGDQARPFTRVDNALINDERISWKAKGIMLYLLSKPDNWIFHDIEIITHATDGKTAYEQGMKELKKYGYVERVRTHNGRIAWQTNVWEAPREIHVQSPDSLCIEIQGIENQGTEIQGIENPQLLTTDKTNDLVTNNGLTNESRNNEKHQPHLSGISNYYKATVGDELTQNQKERVAGLITAMRDESLAYKAIERTYNAAPDKPFRYFAALLANWQDWDMQQLEREDQHFEQTKR